MEWKMEFQTLNPEKNFVDFKKWKVKLERSNWNWKEWSWKDRAFRSVNQKLLNFRFSNLILSNSTIFPTKLSNYPENLCIWGPWVRVWVRTQRSTDQNRSVPGPSIIWNFEPDQDQEKFQNLGPDWTNKILKILDRFLAVRGSLFELMSEKDYFRFENRRRLQIELIKLKLNHPAAA